MSFLNIIKITSCDCTKKKLTHQARTDIKEKERKGGDISMGLSSVYLHKMSYGCTTTVLPHRFWDKRWNIAPQAEQHSFLLQRKFNVDVRHMRLYLWLRELGTNNNKLQ